MLKELGVDSQTAVFFSSDNGAASQYPGELDSTAGLRGGKTSMYEGGLRVPFLVRWPGRVAAGSESDLPIYFPDFLPTAAAIAGIEPKVPQALDGIDLLPELTGAARLPRERKMYWEWNKDHFAPYVVFMQAHRDGKWKIVRNDVSKGWELYDLEADVSESSNLAAAHPEVVERMAAWVAANRVDPPEQVEPDKPRAKSGANKASLRALGDWLRLKLRLGHHGIEHLVDMRHFRIDGGHRDNPDDAFLADIQLPLPRQCPAGSCELSAHGVSALGVRQLQLSWRCKLYVRNRFPDDNLLSLDVFRKRDLQFLFFFLNRMLVGNRPGWAAWIPRPGISAHPGGIAGIIQLPNDGRNETRNSECPAFTR